MDNVTDLSSKIEELRQKGIKLAEQERLAAQGSTPAPSLAQGPAYDTTKSVREKLIDELPFKPGDIVTLKQGGPKLVIGVIELNPDGMFICGLWFNHGEDIKWFNAPVSVLKKLTDDIV